MNLITPNVPLEKIYSGVSKDFEATPPGTYTMALENIRVKQTKAGENKLEAFFIHVDDAAKGLKGVSLSTMLEGIDKNGDSKARQTADLLVALGVAAEDAANGNFAVALEGSAEEGAEWKGVPAAIYIKGDRVDLKGRQARIVVEANTFQGKTTTRGKAAYKVAA